MFGLIRVFRTYVILFCSILLLYFNCCCWFLLRAERWVSFCFLLVCLLLLSVCGFCLHHILEFWYFPYFFLDMLR